MTNFIPEQEKYKTLTPFKLAVLQNFPYIEEDFDALTNYGLLCKIVEYLNNVISNENAVESNVSGLYNAFVSLNNYVSNYFDNLDVQEEINKKLDAMSIDGSLTNLIKNYIDPFIDIQNGRINNIDAKVNTISDKIESSTSGSPAGVFPTISALQQADPDHTKIYIVEEDGEWYFYNTSTNQWKNGGVYQATNIAKRSITPSTTNFINPPINYYDGNVITGYYNGTWNIDPNYKTLKIPCDGNTTYTISKVFGYISEFDSNGNNVKLTGQLGNHTNPYTFTTSVLAREVWVTLQVNSSINDFMMVEGNSLPSEYVPYTGYTLNDEINIDGKNIIDKTITKDKINFITKSENLYNGNKTTGYYNGTWNEDNTYSTLKVPCDGNTTYTISKVFGYISEFDSNGNNVKITGQLGNHTEPYTLTTTSNTSEIWITVLTNWDINQYMVVKGNSLPSSYIEFSEMLDSDIKVNGTTNTFLNNKVVNFLGDSFTARNKYQYMIQRELGIKTVNSYGQGGTKIAGNDSSAFCNRYVNMSDDADLVIVFGGVNDFMGNTLIGTKGSTDKTTMYGSLKVLIEGLLTKYTNKKIIFFTPCHINSSNTSLEYYFANEKNARDISLKTYVDVIKEMCEDYSIPCLDLYRLSQLNNFNITSLTEDGLHPNTDGFEFMSNLMSKFIYINY